MFQLSGFYDKLDTSATSLQCRLQGGPAARCVSGISPDLVCYLLGYPALVPGTLQQQRLEGSFCPKPQTRCAQTCFILVVCFRDLRYKEDLDEEPASDVSLRLPLLFLRLRV